MKPFLDWSLCMIADTSLCPKEILLDKVLAAIHGGVTWVQLRDKQSTTRETIHLGRVLLKKLKPMGIPLIINDRADVALACAANGVHLGQSDLPVPEARQILGEKAIIGLSVESMAQTIAEDASLADYLGVSPIFSTPTKPELISSWNLDGLCNLRRQTSKPLIAIGGIQASNASSVIDAGANGVAVASAILARSNCKNAAQILKQTIVGYYEE